MADTLLKTQGGNVQTQPVVPATGSLAPATPLSQSQLPDTRNIPISTVATTPQKPIITPPTDTTLLHSPIIDNAQTTIDSMNAEQLKADQQSITDAQTKLDPMYAEKTALATQIAGQGAEQVSMEASAGIPQSTDTLKNLNAQITQAVNSYNQKQLTASQSGVPQPVLTGQLRDEALVIGNLTASAQILQGNITAAENTISKTIDAKYSGLTTLYNDKIDTLTRNEALMTDAQKTLAADKKAQYAQELANIKDKAAQEKQDKKDNLMMIQNAQANGASSSTINKALNVINNGGDSIAVARALGAYSSTPAALKTAKSSLGVSDSGNQVTPTKSGGDIIAGVKVPSNISATDVLAVLQGRETLQDIRQTVGRSKTGDAKMQGLRDTIFKIDPTFDFVASNAGGKLVSSAYYQRAIGAINSVLPNIDKIVTLSDQVSRVGVKGVDALLQKGAIQIGNEKVTNFHQAQKLIADEIGVALGAGAVSDMKLQLGFDVTDPSVTPEVFASNMKVIKEFVENRKKGLNELRYSSSVTGGVTPPATIQDAIKSSLTNGGSIINQDGSWQNPPTTK